MKNNSYLFSLIRPQVSKAKAHLSKVTAESVYSYLFLAAVYGLV